MVLPNTVHITTQDGARGTAEMPAGQSAGSTYSLVRLEDGRQIRVPMELLEMQADGSYYLSLDLSEAETDEWLAAAQGEGELLVIPVVQEELQVRKRQFSTGGARVTKRVVERVELVEETGYLEEVEVERVAVNRPLEAPLSPYTEGDTLIIPLIEEVLVVEKRLMLREEVRITRRQVQKGAAKPVTLRSEEVTIEPIPSEQGRESDQV
jgi:stress response protein YsnF